MTLNLRWTVGFFLNKSILWLMKLFFGEWVTFLYLCYSAVTRTKTVAQHFNIDYNETFLNFSSVFSLFEFRKAKEEVKKIVKKIWHHCLICFVARLFESSEIILPKHWKRSFKVHYMHYTENLSVYYSKRVIASL